MSRCPQVSVVIVSFHHGETLPLTIESLHRIGDRHLVEVIVIDNGGDLDDSIAGDQTVLIRPDHNLGYAAAANLATRRARADLLLFLSPDAEILEIDTGRLVQLLAPPVGAIGALTVDHDDRLSVSWGELPGLVRIVRKLLGIRGLQNRTRLHRLAAGHEVEVAWVLGAAMAVKRSLLIDLDGFDESYAVAGEDQDLGARLQRRGLSCLVTPAWKVRHQPRDPRDPEMARIIRANDRRVVRMHGSFLDRLLFG
jgi:GT2 family glycosyltransferase